MDMTIARSAVDAANVSADDHTGCILAIVGSRDCHKNALFLIEGVIDRHRPLMVVSGGATANLTARRNGLMSIDAEAVKVAAQRGIGYAELKPTNFHWDGKGGFKERNIKIAETAMCLVRIASTTTTTYGSGWTADYAEGLGKHVERYVINEQGELHG